MKYMRASLLVCLVALFSGGLVERVFAQTVDQNQPTSPYLNGRPVFTVIPREVKTAAATPEELAILAAAPNIPMWTGSFSSGGSMFSFTMIGTNPASGSATTNVPTMIVPISLRFADGTVLSAGNTVCGDTQTSVARVQNSPLVQRTVNFAPGGTNVGTTQYIDAFQRANFWSNVSATSPNYHVLLSPVTVAAVQSITVPRRSGTTVAGPCARIGEMDINFYDAQLQSIITRLGIPATILPVFLSYNTFETSSGLCCILGYHSANSSNHTYSVAAYSDPGIFSVPIEDIHALSHELGEWMDDPFGNNIVPAWGNVGQVSGCQDNLEDGDPVTGTAFTVTLGGFTYHPEDLVFVPWFEKAATSTSVNGWFTFLNTFSSSAAACP